MPDTFIIAELNKYTLEFAAILQKALYAGGFRYAVEVVPPKAPTIPCGSISAELHIVEISSGENRATLWTNSRSGGISVSARYHDGSKFGKDFFSTNVKFVIFNPATRKPLTRLLRSSTLL